MQNMGRNLFTPLNKMQLALITLFHETHGRQINFGVVTIGAKFCPDLTKCSESYEQSFVPATKQNVAVTWLACTELRHIRHRFVNLLCNEFYGNGTISLFLGITSRTYRRA
jgi:hypothetical protein